LPCPGNYEVLINNEFTNKFYINSENCGRNVLNTEEYYLDKYGRNKWIAFYIISIETIGL